MWEVRTEGNMPIFWDYLVLCVEQEESANLDRKHRQANRQLAEGLGSKCSQYREEQDHKVIDDM